MPTTHYQIQINGWSKPRFFSVGEAGMFFQVTACPAEKSCEACKDHLEWTKVCFRYAELEFRESLSPSGFIGFGFEVDTVGEGFDPMEFMQNLLGAEIRVLKQWQAGEDPK